MTKLEKRYMESASIKNSIYNHLEKMNDYIIGIEPIIGINKQLLEHGRKQAALTSWDKVKIIPAKETKLPPTFEGMVLSTPALVAAYNMKILTSINFVEIKNGGMQILEKYMITNDAVKKIYSTIVVLFHPATYTILAKKDRTQETEANEKSKFELEYLKFVDMNKTKRPMLPSY